MSHASSIRCTTRHSVCQHRPPAFGRVATARQPQHSFSFRCERSRQDAPATTHAQAVAVNLHSPAAPAEEGSAHAAYSHEHSDRSDSAKQHVPPSPPPAAAMTFISHLDIRNLALIAHQSFDLHPGLNVISGESGAGKSMVIQAVSAVLGAPAGEDVIRAGEASCIVEATLHLSPAAQVQTVQLLSTLELPKRALPGGGRHDMTTLRIRREMKREGSTMRSRCSINGAPTTLRLLRRLASTFADVNGQHSNLSLRESATQVAMLDRLAGSGRAAVSFGSTLSQLRTIQSKLAALASLGNEDHREKLQALVDGVRAIGIKDGEERRLRAELRRTEARRSAVEQCQLACSALGNDGGIEDGLVIVEGNLQNVLQQEYAADAKAQEEREERDDTKYDAYEEDEDVSGAPLIEDAMDILEQSRQLMAEAEAKVTEYASRFRFSAADAEDLSSRLSLIMRCLKQYGATSTGDLLTSAAEAEQDLDSYYQLEGQRGEMEHQAEHLLADLAVQGAALSQRRRSAAGHLRAAVEAALSQLCMAGSRFDVRIAWEQLPQAEGGIPVGHAAAGTAHEAGDLSYRGGDSGLDKVEFLLAAGPSEPLRPLGAVASGGESARIMMALKAAPAAATAAARDATSLTRPPHSEDETTAGQPVMILDEIDSGVGSRLGASIAQMLRRMAAPGGTAQQIICVSHLPQVAAYAQHHLCVRKHQGPDGRMHTAVVPLVSQDERLQEVADMLGVDQSRGSAVLMLQEAAGR